MSDVLDDPARPDQDALERTGLAQSIYSLITQAPDDWTLRIGVYGRWGEGKTTLLHVIANLATSDGLPVVHFNPSFAGDATQLWNLFGLALLDAFDKTAGIGTTGGSVTPRMPWLRAKVASATGLGKFLKPVEALHPMVGAVSGLVQLGGDTLREHIGLSQKAIDALVRSKVGDKRLVVFIDDVDRVEPHLVPRLLLALREQLNVQRTAFVVALDPGVVTEGLSAVHPGWKDAPEFLEKILQFHYWLPPLDSATVSKLARLQIPATQLDIPPDVVEELASSLPRNPRKLKEFFRSLWQLTPVVQRHDSSDVDWTLLLLLELLRAEAPLLTGDLLRSKPIRESIAASTFFGKLSDEKRQKEGRDRLVQEFEGVVAQQVPPERKERLLRIIDKFGAAPLTTADRIEYWGNIRERPPAMTSKEATQIFEAWTGERTTAKLQRLIANHTAKTTADLSAATSGLFRNLIDLREAQLNAASESDVVQELHDHVDRANEILNLLATIVLELGLFRNEPREAAVIDFSHLYDHVAHWAHFNNTDEYRTARQRECSVLLEGASLAQNIAAAALRHLKFSELFPSMLLQPAARRLREDVITALLPFVIADVRNRFERHEGISSLFGTDMGVHYYLLMNSTAGVYTDEFIDRLRVLSVEAQSNLTVQKNMIALIRAMATSYGGVNAESVDAQQRLKKAAEFLPHVWAGAIASPVQPRLLGSLREDLGRLNSIFGQSDVQLATPAWWRDPDVATEADPQGETV